MAIRTLTKAEKRRISEARRIEEMSAHPDKMVSVRVEGETDERGEPIVWVHYIGERQSNDWKRNT